MLPLLPATQLEFQMECVYILTLQYYANLSVIMNAGKGFAAVWMQPVVIILFVMTGSDLS